MAVSVAWFSFSDLRFSSFAPMGISETRRKQNRFRSLLKISIFLTYLVILAGSVVRMTGSGMGCPDWPKCFGSVIPPTDISQLPEGYEQHYIEVRKAKNQKLAKMLRPLGFDELATQISEDPSVYEETQFVWEKTWTEYVNRLAGASLGIALLASFFASLIYWKKRRKIPLLVLGVIVITGFQGWMGSVVVSTNLLPGVLTAHMVLAFALIAGLMYLYVKTAPGIRTSTSFNIDNTMRYALGVLIVITLVQVFLGTQVRQQMDVISKSFNLQHRELWVAALNWVFKVHRSFSLLLVFGNAWLCYQIYKYLNHYFAVFRASIYLAVFVSITTISGIIMAYLDVPAWAQPLHLLLSCMIFGVQVYLFVALGRKTRIQTVATSSAASR
ncbi:MAG: heme A synthase [Flavobacteriales bacterium]|nr:heme A synthase [Flavobacteriales bacterium]